MKHRVQISVVNGRAKNLVLRSGVKRIPYRIFTALFGEFTEVLVLTRGQSVESVEIREIPEGGAVNENCR